MNKSIIRGTIEYSRRAFHQDAMDAMRGDIVRGLIELVTNADDAYAEKENGASQNKIIIEVEHRRGQPWRVLVKDRAIGMDKDALLDAITKLGGRTSGFEEGKDKRGNLGRGAKDCAAFGDVTFKTIHNGQYASLLLKSDGAWELLESKKVKADDRTNLGIPRGNGTVVQINVMENILCPLHDNLKVKLSTHYQLRDILSDPSRKVELVKINDGTRDLLTYEYPDIPVVFEDKIDIEGYSGKEASLIIFRHNERYEDGPQEPGRPHGILIKGRRAIYENTLFGYENNVHAGWFSGKLECIYIDQLAREYDDRLEAEEVHPKENPLPIISRRREELNRDHPFVQALRKAVEIPLNELVEKEAKKAEEGRDQIENEQTRSVLDKLAREVSRLINEELRDIEAEELTGTEEGDPPRLSIVPEIAFAYMGEDRTLTVAARKDVVELEEDIYITLDPEGVAELLTSSIRLRDHSRREDLLVGQVRLRPILQDESTLVTARTGDLTANALVEIRPPREIVEVEIELPENLMFERPSYQVGWQKTKQIRLMAPAEVIAEQGTAARISCSDSGVVIRTPSVEFKYDDSVEFYRSTIQVEGRKLDASGDLRTELGTLFTTAQIKVTRKEEGPGFKIKLEPDDFGSFRGILDKEEMESGQHINVIKIATRHPAIRPVIGDDFGGQNSPICRALIAEIVADVSARHIVGELYRIRRGTEDFDSDRIYREHYKRIRRFLPRFQKLLLGDIRKAGSEESLDPISILN